MSWIVFISSDNSKIWLFLTKLSISGQNYVIFEPDLEWTRPILIFIQANKQVNKRNTLLDSGGGTRSDLVEIRLSFHMSLFYCLLPLPDIKVTGSLILISKALSAAISFPSKRDWSSVKWFKVIKNVVIKQTKTKNKIFPSFFGNLRMA